jgi:hypothetical protein
LTSFSLQICPSVCPLDQGNAIAAATAAFSFDTPIAKHVLYGVEKAFGSVEKRNAVHSKLSASQVHTTLEIKVAYLPPITAETEPLRTEGARPVDWRARRLRRGGDQGRERTRLLDSATSTLLIMER